MTFTSVIFQNAISTHSSVVFTLHPGHQHCTVFSLQRCEFSVLCHCTPSLQSVLSRRRLDNLLLQYHGHHPEGTKGQARIKAQIDELVASDCPMCGWLMIE